MNQMINHPSFGHIRVELINSEPWFVANDVCQAIGLVNPAKSVLDHCHTEDVCKVSVATGGGKQLLTAVNESGLYALIFGSRKDKAIIFKRWVTKEVLPAIRQYGFYSTDAKKMEAAQKRAEKKAVSTLLRTVDRHLSGSDKRIVGKQCLTTEYEVNSVLAGRREDLHMMSLLYGRAAGNREFRNTFYSLEGATNLLLELEKIATKKG